MPKTVTLVRHAETTANASGVWQGTTDAQLSDNGRQQVTQLAERVASWEPDLVVSSDLTRTMETSRAFGDADPEPGFREFAIGRWEGLTSAEVAARYPDEWHAFLNWEDIAPGGGERLSDFAERVQRSLDKVIDALSDDGHAVVVAHGGVIWSLMSQLLGVDGSARMIPSHNTALSTIEVDDAGRRRIITFNDSTHIPPPPRQFGPGGQVATLIRHGQSEGNLTGRWHGITDSPLTDHGRKQAERAAPYAPAAQHMFSSPLSRAHDTATIIGEPHKLAPSIDEGLVEMSFGVWEGMSTPEIMSAYADEMAIYENGDGDDAPRGISGESLTGAGERMAKTVERLAEETEGAPFIGVSHGAAIRAYALNVLGAKNAGRGKVALVRNTSLSSVVMTPNGPILASYNTGRHLED